MAKLLITGVGGAMGANLALALSKCFHVTGLCHGAFAQPSGCATLAFDTCRSSDISPLLDQIKPDWVIHCGPMSRSIWDIPAEEELALETVGYLVAWAAECQARNTALTVMSTDAVFAGPRLFHEESCVPTSQTAQARHARAIEEALMGTPALVVRAHAYGWSPLAERCGFADGVAESIESGHNAMAPGLRYATPMLVTDLAPLLEKAFELNLQGLYHITGAERVNQHRFVSQLAAAMDKKCSSADSETLVNSSPRVIIPASETSLNTRKARRDLGSAMPLLNEGLERFVAQRSDGYLDRLRIGSRVARGAIAA